jgi:hypothetical protein
MGYGEKDHKDHRGKVIFSLCHIKEIDYSFLAVLGLDSEPHVC